MTSTEQMFTWGGTQPLTPTDIAEMARDRTSLIWSPRSNITLYGDTARVTEYARLGVPIALGSDWIISGSMNMLREMRCADSLDANFYGDFFTDEAIWLMATRDAAAALAVDDAVGVIATGRVADLAIFNGAMHRDHRAVIDAMGVRQKVREGQRVGVDGRIPACVWQQRHDRIRQPESMVGREQRNTETGE